MRIILTIVFVGSVFGCAKPAQQKSNVVRDCWGGSVTMLAFASAIPNRVEAIYTEHYEGGQQPFTEVRSECSSASQIFYREENALHVAIGAFGTWSPKVYDLEIRDCASGQTVFRKQSIAPDNGGQFCQATVTEFSVD